MEHTSERVLLYTFKTLLLLLIPLAGYKQLHSGSHSDTVHENKMQLIFVQHLQYEMP